MTEPKKDKDQPKRTATRRPVTIKRSEPGKPFPEPLEELLEEAREYMPVYAGMTEEYGDPMAEQWSPTDFIWGEK